MSWLVFVSTFLAASVEWVEAFTIVLAVGMFKDWKSAWAGACAAAGLLLIAIAVFGTTVGSFPIGAAQTVVGIFLLLFGLRWLHKAVLRSAGLKAKHNEAEEFEETREKLLRAQTTDGSIDWVGATTAFNGVLLEGLEVIFIVIALGGLKSTISATIGAAVALAAVLVAGVILRAPLTRVPENAMKYVVGLMLAAFGTFFTGEGIGVTWWHADVSILLLIAWYGIASLTCVQLLRKPPRLSNGDTLRVPKAIFNELWGLLVGENTIALTSVCVVLAVALFTDRLGHHRLAAVLLALGAVASVAIALAESARAVFNKRGTEPTIVAAPAAVGDTASNPRPEYMPAPTSIQVEGQ
jgi:Ca2+/H+ antiporter, TMEM165/GDT1 family